jgi:hypothetical protein
MRLGDPSRSPNPRLLIRRQPRVRPRDKASRCVQGQAQTATQTETQTAAATTTTTTGFAVGLQRAVLGGGVTTAASASALLPLLPLLPGHASACNVDDDQASRSTCRIRRKGDGAWSPCWHSHPSPRSLLGGLVTHALRTALRTAWSGDFRLVGVIALNQVPVAGVVWRRWRRWRRWSRSPCHGGRAGVTYSRAAASWAIAGPCRELSSTLFQPRRPSERTGWQPYGERLTCHPASTALPCRILLPSPGVRGAGPVSSASHWIRVYPGRPSSSS